MYSEAFATMAWMYRVQALTKYVGGHSDLLLGSVTAVDEDLCKRIDVTRQRLGVAVSPDDCSLALRGLQTLYVRLHTAVH